MSFFVESKAVAGGLGAQYEYFSAQVEVKKFDATRANWIESLKLERRKELEKRMKRRTHLNGGSRHH